MSVSQANGGTRSGLIWEVERILKELSREREHRGLPQVLLMENVPEVVGANNLEDFIKWQNTLEELGYKNYVEILNSKDYGIPQNRKRCFMVSLLGEYTYNFPIKLKREYKLKDLLQKVCPKKYYLTNEHIGRISNWKAHQKPLENVINPTSGAVSPTITARGAGEDHSGMILVNGESLFKDMEVVDFDSSDEFRREHGEDAPTLVTKAKFGVVEKNNGGIPIMENTKKGYKIAHNGDGVDIGGRMKNHRGTVQKGLSQTLKTNCDVGVVVNEDEKPKVIGSYQPNSFCAGQVVDPDGIAPTFLENHGSVMGVIEKDEVELVGGIGEKKSNGGRQYFEQNRIYNGENIATTIPAEKSFHPYYTENVSGPNLKIRKLTPKECVRLMGFENSDYEAMRKIGMTDTNIYRMSGDSIVVTVLISIFSQLIYENDEHKQIVKEYIKKGIIEK